MEALARVIRDNKGIEGIPIENMEKKIGLIADKTLLVTKACRSSLKELERVLSEFERQSGLKINYNKSVIAVVGGHRLNYSMFIRKEFVWLKPEETFTYLGLEYFIDHDGRLQTSDNFCRMHYQIDNAVKHLHYQQRSLLG